MKYRKKPVVIEAVEWRGDNLDEIKAFFGDTLGAWLSTDARSNDTVCINTLEGVMVASKGDYIIKGVKGEFYPCKPDIFAATYEAVE